MYGFTTGVGSGRCGALSGAGRPVVSLVRVHACDAGIHVWGSAVGVDAGTAQKYKLW